MHSRLDKTPKSRSEIERLVLQELQSSDRCEGAAAVTVVAWQDEVQDANWALSTYDNGTAPDYDCVLALQEIVPRFQRFYELVEKH